MKPSFASLMRVAVVLALTALAASTAVGDVVKITAASPGNWSWLPANGGSCDFRWAAGGGSRPPGAFYATTGTGGSAGNTGPPPGQVWLGTNQYVGTALSSITRLDYYTFTFPQGQPNGNLPRQPIQVQLIVDEAPPSGALRTLMHRPWGLKGATSGNPYGQWVAHDALATDSIWYCPQKDSDGIFGECYGNWDWVKATFPNAVLATPPAGIGWDKKTVPPGSPEYTGTGYCLNLEVGARKSVTKIFDTGPNTFNWWSESYNFAGYVDDLTIGVDGQETTYDFDVADRPVIGINNKAALDPIMATAKDTFYFTVWGRVQAGSVTAGSFVLDDGSGNMVTVYADGHNVIENDFARAKGRLVPPATLYSLADWVWYY